MSAIRTVAGQRAASASAIRHTMGCNLGARAEDLRLGACSAHDAGQVSETLSLVERLRLNVEENFHNA